jgi:hypothetical protein
MRLACPPPLPSNAAAPIVRLPPQPPRPTDRKKVFWIVVLCLLGGLGITVVVGALLFGGCMWLIQKAGH